MPVTTIDANGTFTVPAGVFSALIECQGKGGTGADSIGLNGGDGGGGGAFSSGPVVLVPGAVENVFVDGTSGNCYFRNPATVMAVHGNMPAGGLASACVGTTRYSGGDGASSASPSGGNGGTVATSAGAGTAGGQANGGSSGQNGSAGTPPGNGGGGGGQGANGAAGGQGRITITYNVVDVMRGDVKIMPAILGTVSIRQPLGIETSLPGFKGTVTLNPLT